MTAQDIGAGVPGDAGDSLPATPTDGVITDFTVPTPLPSSKFTQSTPQSDGLTEIDIRSTPIKDSLKFLEATLAPLLALAEDASGNSQLAISILGLISGNDPNGDPQLARAHYYYDDVSNIWRQPTGILMQVVSILDDHLTCQRLQDGVATGDPINVAKSFRMRRNPFDGNVYGNLSFVYTTHSARLATVVGSSPVDQEDQVVIPAWVVGDELTVARLVDPVTINDALIDYIDLNNDARAWARRDDL